ncbi:MAG: hypothetical protein Q4F15_02335 [Bacillota bacterium]|nr:hypothetical protein [Bacillota bacterium]
MKNKKLIALPIIALFGAVSLASCSGNSQAAVDQIYVYSEIVEDTTVGYIYYDSYYLELYQDSTYSYTKTEITYGYTMNLATTVIVNEGSFTTGATSDGYTAITLGAATRVVFQSYSDVGGYNLDIDSDTVSYPTELLASGEGEKVYAQNFEELQAAYGEEKTVYLGDANKFYLTNPAA